MMRLAPLLLACICIWALPASAQVVFTGSGNWSAVNAYSGTFTGVPAAGEDFSCSPGITVTVTGDIIADSTVGADWDFSGCTLSNTGGYVLTLPADGLVADTPVLTGLIATGPDNAVPAFTDTTPDPLSYARIGRIMYCPGDPTAGEGGTPVSDCGGAQVGDAGVTNEILLYWDDAYFDSVVDGIAGERFYPDWIALAEVGHELCFWPPSEFTQPASQDNHCFTITDIQYNDVAAFRGLVIDVNQGTNNPGAAVSYTLAERAITIATITNAATAGARSIVVADTAVSTFDRSGRGKYLSCPRADGTFPGTYSRIIDVADGGVGDDTLTLGKGGILQDVAATDGCFLDILGIRQGDPVYLVDPVVINSATAGDADSTVSFTGASLKNVLIDSVGVVNLTQGAAGDTSVENLVLRDISGAGAGLVSLRLEDYTGITLKNVSITGGDATLDDVHGLSWGDTTNNIVLKGFACRYNGDDCIVRDNGTADTLLTGTRIRCDFLSGGGTTANCIGSGTSGTFTYTVRDVLAVNAAIDEATGSLFQCGDDSTCYLQNVVTLGNDNLLGGVNVLNWYDVGTTLGGTITNSSWAPSKAVNFVSRDLTLASTNDIVSQSYAGEGGQNGLWVDADTTIATSNMFSTALTGGVLWDNAAIINPISVSTGTQSIVRCSSTLTGATVYRNFGIHFAPNTAVDQIDRAFNITCNGATFLTLDGLAITGFIDGVDADTDATAILSSLDGQFTDTVFLNSVCFSNNTLDVPTNRDEDFDVTPTRSDELGFVNVNAERFDPAPGSLMQQVDCGLRKQVSVPFLWGMQILGMTPDDDPHIVANPSVAVPPSNGPRAHP